MSDKRSDDLGDRMKAYEQPSTSRKAFKGQPVVVRLDGKNFHTFTKGLKRPYDERLSNIMVESVQELVAEFQPTIAYTQSDEVTMIFLSETNDVGELLYDGRFQKLDSLCAAAMSVEFYSRLHDQLPEKAKLKPKFDGRSYVVPNVQEAYHVLLWRQMDATKNAISMAAQSFYTQKELNGKHSSELQEMIFQKGQNFNDYPPFFKRGTFVKRVAVERHMTEAELERIPEKYRPTGPIQRSEISIVDYWLTKLNDPIQELFGKV